MTFPLLGILILPSSYCLLVLVIIPFYSKIGKYLSLGSGESNFSFLLVEENEDLLLIEKVD